MRSASAWERRAISVSGMREPRSACAVEMIRSASWRACSTIWSRPPISSWAWASESGRAARTSSSRASRSARLTTHEADIGIDRALETAVTISSSFFCTSTGCSPLSTAVLETDGTTVAPSVLPQAFVERLQDDRGNEVGDVPAPGGDLLDQRGGEEAVGGVGGHEQRLDAREAVVHLGHLQLVVEVADRAQALDDGRDVALLAEVDEEAVEGLDADVAVLGGDLADQVDPLVDLEQALLGLVDHDRDIDLVIQTGGAGNDVEVSVGDRVERPGTYGAAHL